MHSAPQPRPFGHLTAAALAAVLALPLSSVVMAQSQTRSTPIYRCGPDGRDLRDAPCPEAADKAPKTISFDQPSAADRRAAQELAQQEARRARELEVQRQQQEAEARRHAAPAIAIHGRGQPPAAAPAPSKQAQAPMPPKAPKSPKPPKPPKVTQPGKAAKPASAAS
jgi:hypothetical protein